MCKSFIKCESPPPPNTHTYTPSATHTITLHLDMTSLDMSDAKPCCKRRELQKYRRLGLSVEEVVEVSMKLNALKGLGIHLGIEGERERERERDVIHILCYLL